MAYPTKNLSADGAPDIRSLALAIRDNVPDGGPITVNQSVGAEAANIITVTCEFRDRSGVALTSVGTLPFYLADDAAGATPSTVAPTVGTAATTGAIIEHTANLSGLAVATAAGALVITLEDAGTPTFFLVFVLPNGLLGVSAAITFA